MERRLAAILAADVVGYTRLMGVDEAGTFRRLTDLRKTILDPLISEHHGRIVKLMGDGLLVEFASAVDSVACAMAWQNSVAQHEAGGDMDTVLQFRIGINLGDVIVEDGDIHGDGVNIAARLEGLAQPGGICLSDDVYRHAKGKIEAHFEDIGEQKLKNVADPVRVYSVAIEPSAKKAPSSATETLALPDKPSIAVLPFVNMSGDPEQEYFCDGITEDIITNLSRFRDFFVIARNSTFAYKGKAINVKDVGRELGVGYILEGSIQKSANRVRITAQLVDGETGAHLWSERYDRQIDDTFDVQDEVTELIVGTLASGYGGRLRKAWQRRERATTEKSIQAFDYFMRGMDLFDKWTKEDTRLGREFFEKAIELEPMHAKALAKLAWSHLEDAAQDWSEDYDCSVAKGLEFATSSIEAEDEEAWGHWALAGYYLLTKNHDLAVAEILRASELNPNDADVMTDVAYIFSFAGRADEALEYAHRAIRLNPHHPEWYLMQLAPIYFDARRYEDAITTFRRLRGIDTTISNLYRAAAYAAQGDAEGAKKSIGRILELDRNATVTKWTSAKMAPYADASDRTHLCNNLRKAGLPD